jgi:sporulation protein YlmC with PRC-barrel domain
MLRDRDSHEYSKFVEVGPKHSAVLTNDITMASNMLQISAVAVAFTAGAAGTTGVVGLDAAPVYDSTGTKIGDVDDTSFAFVTGTILTTEVAIDNSLSQTAFLASLSQGEYAIDYVLGKIYYNKATAGTADTANYKTRQLNVDITTITAPPMGATAPQATGVDLVGADTYTTIITAGLAATHIYISCEGAYDAIVSVNSGTTDHFRIPANSAHVFDNVTIAAAATVQGKNATAGQNYTNLTVTIW